MCGRFTLTASPEQLAETFDLDEVPELAPRFNVAPSQAVATVFVPDTAESEARAPARRCALRRWGLIPFWADDERIGNRQINARAETAAEKPAFREALRRRRCLVPANGFYEWSGPSRPKQPYFIGLPDRSLLGFAGLWERWKNPDGQVVESCAVLTTAANELLRELHDRMPVVIAPADYGAWLDPATRDAKKLARLQASQASDALTFFPVSHRVNDVACDDEGCLERIESQPSLF